MRTCADCGEEKSESEFYVYKQTGQPYKHCKSCNNERARLHKRDCGRTEHEHAATRQRNHKLQNRTILGATKKGQPWTAVDIELMRRTDLTVTEIAQRLGRTYKAVVMMRSKDKQHARA